jgi:light-regulated signal transduction histidine kinase (bacteriophytochrome)
VTAQIVTTVCPESRARYRARSGVEQTMTVWDLADAKGSGWCGSSTTPSTGTRSSPGPSLQPPSPRDRRSSDGDKGDSGLGLRTAKAIVERLGGQIGFEAGSDTGTTLFSGQPE